MAISFDTIEQALKERREDRELAQPELAKRIRDLGIKASQSRMSDIERGYASFLTYWVKPADRYRVLKEYGFRDDEIRKLNQKFSLGVESLLPLLTVHASNEAFVRYFGPVNAGITETDLAIEREERVSAPDWILDKYDPSLVFAMDIVGDSMACEDAHKSIPEGSRVYFLEGAEPKPGELVCSRLFDLGAHVLKVFKPEADYVILESYNHKHSPIVLNEQNPGDVAGVYLTHIPRGPRLR